MPVGPVVTCVVAVVALLIAERRQSSFGRWLAKPVASASFVALALMCGALDASYGRWIAVALVASLVGDVLLIPVDRPRVFRAGVLAFMAAHVAFIVAFFARPIRIGAIVVAACVTSLILWAAWRWMRRSLPADLRGPVVAYLVVIGAMAACAIGVTAAGGPITVSAAAVAFAASDLSVARDRFVAPGFVNQAWGLPLYYAAQLLFAASTGPLR